MAGWNEAKQKWTCGKSNPIRYCFVDPKEGSKHPIRAWTAAEKKVGTAAIAEWNKALKKKAGVNYDLIVPAEAGKPCDITLRWEDQRFFKDWRAGGKGADLSTSSGYGSAKGNGSLNELKKDKTTPYTPGRDTTKFPENEAYFNSSPPRPYTVSEADYKGWFVDPTPDADTEFDQHGGDIPETADKKFWSAKMTGPAANAWDLYTAILHEFGHMLGLGHNGKAGDPDTDHGQVMADGAGDRERRHVPDSTVGFNERRHLTASDESSLEDCVTVAPEAPLEWLMFAIRALFGGLVR